MGKPQASQAPADDAYGLRCHRFVSLSSDFVCEIILTKVISVNQWSKWVATTKRQCKICLTSQAHTMSKKFEQVPANMFVSMASMDKIVMGCCSCHCTMTKLGDPLIPCLSGRKRTISQVFQLNNRQYINVGNLSMQKRKWIPRTMMGSLPLPLIFAGRKKKQRNHCRDLPCLLHLSRAIVASWSTPQDPVIIFAILGNF